jgi:hypothetical protein
MHPVAKYRQFASNSRRLAAMLANPADKQALELMATGWDKVANSWEATLSRSNEQREPRYSALDDLLFGQIRKNRSPIESLTCADDGAHSG